MDEVHMRIPIAQKTLKPDNEVFFIRGDGTPLNAWFQVVQPSEPATLGASV